eukprot:jgi/Botrbrau1/13747/Bobra.0056s0004.1
MALELALSAVLADDERHAPLAVQDAERKSNTPEAIAKLVDFSPHELADLLSLPQELPPGIPARREVAARCEHLLGTMGTSRPLGGVPWTPPRLGAHAEPFNFQEQDTQLYEELTRLAEDLKLECDRLASALESALLDKRPNEAGRMRTAQKKAGPQSSDLDAAVAKLEKEMRLAAQGLDPSVLTSRANQRPKLGDTIKTGREKPN